MKYINEFSLNKIDDFLFLNLKNIKINDLIIHKNITSKDISKYKNEILSNVMLLDYIIDQNGLLIHEFNFSKNNILKFESPILCYNYAHYILQGPFPEGEDIICTSSMHSYIYARNIIKGPWLKGEEIISNDSYWSYHYARNIIKGRWFKCEDLIIKNPESCFLYIKSIINDRFKKCEPYIMNSEYKEIYLFYLKEKKIDTKELEKLYP